MMKILQLTLMTLLVSCLFVIGAAVPTSKPDAPRQHNLMPVPASVQFQAGRLVVSREFSVALLGQSDARIQSAIGRMLKRLEDRTGYELARTFRPDQNGATLVVQCNAAGQDPPSFKEDESYSLEISDQQARLVAPTVVGAIRGVETLLQLLESDRDGYYFPNVKIQDQPRFPWRGLLIDVGRHFQPVEVLKRNLDAMAAVKLNVLHWHLTEDQGFRIESRKYPKLHQMGSDGLYYTQEQAREIIAYARERGIRVLPEFDMPGHATSWLVGYPELGSAPGPYEIERRPGIFEPALDPTREEVYKFLDGFLGEMASLFPDEYIHIGGDENEGKQWDRNPRIQAFMKQKGIKDNHALQTYFNKRVLQILRKHGKKMMGWDEIFQPDLPNEVIIHSWRGPTSLAEAARKGFNGVLSAGYYIDLSFPTSSHYAIDPLPTNSGLTSAEAAHVLGGEATMWSEWVTPETIDSRIWPRTAAIAERLWSPGTVVDVDDMYRRLSVISVQLEELGLTHEKNVRMLLRRLTQGGEIGPLQTLASVVEPVKEYRRYQMRPQTMLSPLTGLIDAARPDSAAARNFGVMVESFLADAPRFQLRRENAHETLTRWRDAGLDLEALIDRSPALHEAKPLAKDLREIGGAGLEAMSYLTAGVAPSPEWRDTKLAILDEAAKPKAALEFAIVPAVRELVIAASEFSRLQQTTPGEWRTHVRTLSRAAK